MKKLLAVLMAVLLLCGGLAVGVNAAGWDDLNNAQKNELESILFSARLEVCYSKEYYDTYVMLTVAETCWKKSAVYKPEKNPDEIDFSTLPEGESFYDPLYRSTEEDKVNAYLNGTLEEDSRKEEENVMKLVKSTYVPIMTEYFQSEAIEAYKLRGSASLLWEQMPFCMLKAGIITRDAVDPMYEYHDEIVAKVRTVMDPLLDEGKWAQAKATGEEVLARVIELLVEHGLMNLCTVCSKFPCECTTEQPCPDCGKLPCECTTEQPCATCGKDPCECPEIIPEPSFFARVWDFILKWLLFGWLWNR